MDGVAIAVAGILWLLAFAAIALIAGAYDRLRY
jgi:hypothetical protein